ncbi:hypothetical protein [Reichenbachiella ulvae]|uniref:Uncharacterized protein n=1 Tax=Reichenbachiella ulvae TaxID=2980104 RepID=A0ABT3CN46_9BACT|nr:hypothetical protein [Reichenbachiella ulvae]MCV9385071.1 hypothetical protein [Reichenbachiella ulvae]
MPKKKNKRKKSSKKHLGHKAMVKRHIKERYAQFCKKVDAVLEDIEAEELRADMSKEDLRLMYILRFQSPRVESAEEFQFHPKTIKDFQKVINKYMEDNTFSLEGSDQILTFHDYFNVIKSLNCWVHSMEKEEYPSISVYIKEIKPIDDYCNLSNNAERHFFVFLQMLSKEITPNPFKELYFFTAQYEEQTHPRRSYGYKVYIHGATPTIKTVKLDSHNRSVCMYLANGNGSAAVPKLKASDIDPNSLIRNLELPVYYQKHVMGRLYERVDCFDRNLMRCCMDQSLLSPKLTPISSTRALLTYSFYGFKLGYFVVEVIDGIALLRTFLFLTNDDTPEGDLLKRNLGISKLDKKYTGLDRLSTFLHSDIKEDKQLHDLLKASNCDHLLHAHSCIMEFSNQSSSAFDADSMKKYLMVEEESLSESA